MPKPLRSEDPTPSSVQFSHFGVLNDGQQSKGAFTVSFITNILILLLVIVVGSVVKKEIVTNKKETISYVEPIKEAPKPPPPPPPKIVAPKIVEVPKPIEPPKIQPPVVEKAPEIKPLQPIPQPKPVLAPPAPKKVEAPPAPKVVNLAQPKAASIPNNDTHPSAVALGHPDSPIKNGLTGPAVSNIRLGQGMPNMPAGNTGNGPASKSVNLGSGAPNGTNVNGTGKGPVAVPGLGTGCPGCTGKGPAQGPVAVKIAPQMATTPTAKAPTVAAATAKPPVVTFVPKPVYSAEAKELHLEGDAQVRVKFLSTGSMEVLGLAHGLGHGLDQAALDAARGIRFRPATDAAGNPVDFPTTVTVHFLIN